MKIAYVPTNESQKWILPNFSFIILPVIFGNQKYVPAKIPNIAATPMTMWKCPTTKYVAWSMISIEGCARKKPLTPPLTNMEIKPSANRDAELIRNLEPYRLPIQIRTRMVDGMVIISVGKENASEENGFMPLTNMWCP